MLARSVRKPLVIGLGTGVVLITGGAPAALAASTGSPSPSASESSSSSASPSVKPPTAPTPKPKPRPVLHVELTRASSAAIHAGGVVTLTALVATDQGTAHDVKLSLGADHQALVEARCALAAGLCKLGDVGRAGQPVEFTVTVSGKMRSGAITVSAYAFSKKDGVDVEGVTRLTVQKKPTPKPTPTPKATHSIGSGGGHTGGGSGSGTGSGGGSGGGQNPGNTNPSDGGGTESSTAPSATSTSLLPTADQDQAPSIAPLAQNAGNSQSMRGSAEGPDELTFDELASTQAAWLVALLVVFSLLLTQLRLGKAGARSARATTPKGAHRRGRLRGGR